MQVEERQDFGDLRGPLSLNSFVIDAAIVDPRRRDLDRAGRSDHGPGPVMAVANY
jgi:hypothetical protein